MRKFLDGDHVLPCTKTKHGSMTVEPRLIGKLAVVTGMTELRGAGQPFYILQFPGGEIDHADQDCLRRA